MSSLKRLNKERAELANNAPDGITAAPEGDNLFKWTAMINGPSGSPYEGYAFDMAVEFPAEYPFKPPKVVFTTPVYHMNVSEDGHVCLEIIQSGWGPVLTLSKVLQAVQGLLSEPNPSNPLRGELAAQFASDRAAHDAAARSFTAQKATALRR